MTGTVFFGTEELSVGESDRFVYVPIVRTDDLSGTAVINYAITSDTATAGADYTASSGSVTMVAGQGRAVIPVRILNDKVLEPTETFTLSIISVDSGTGLLFPRTTRVDILDDENPVVDPPEPPLTSSFIVTQQPIITGLSQPMAFEFAPQDPSLIYIAEKGGRIRVFDVDTGGFLPDFVDLTAQVNDVFDRGLMDIAIHPDFPQQPYVYAFYVVDTPDTVGNVGNAGPDGAGNRFAYVVRLTADAATGFTTLLPGSEVILVGGAGQTLADISGGGIIDSNSDLAQPESGVDALTGAYRDNYIKVDSTSHAGGSLAFGPDGALYISVGDGASFNAADPRAVSVQDINSLSGKILRVDPMTGLGLPDNPFVQAGEFIETNHAKVYQLGLRNGFSMAFDPNGQLIITNTGWNSWEEIESGPAGANFGWPYYEGGDNGVLLKASGYQDFPSAAEFYAAVESGAVVITTAYRAFAHASSEPGFQVQAITGGDAIYTGSRYPAQFQNDFFFADIVDGEVYSVDMNDRRDVQFLYATGDGPVHFSQGPDGYVYYAGLFSGNIGRLLIEPLTITSPSPFTLTTGADTVVFAGGTNIVNGTSLTLNASDSLSGGAGFDTLSLSGGGTFDLTVLARFTGFEAIKLGGAQDYALTLPTDTSLDLSVGSGSTSLVAGGGGIINVDASSLGKSETLTLSGSTAVTVTGLAGNLAASLSSGALNVTTGKNAKSLSVATGSASAVITSNGSKNDVVLIDATALGTGSTLTFIGSSAAIISGLGGGNLSAATASNDIMVTAGGAGVHSITTGAGKNSLTGGSGADILTAGGGADKLTGGPGEDLFRYVTAPDSPWARNNRTVDTISDFQIGVDQIDLSAFGWESSTVRSGVAYAPSGRALTNFFHTDGAGGGALNRAAISTVSGGGATRLFVDNNGSGNLDTGDMMITFSTDQSALTESSIRWV